MHRIITNAMAGALLVIVIFMSESVLATELSSGWRHNYQRELIVTPYGDATRPLFYVDANGNYWKTLGGGWGPYRLVSKPAVRLVWDAVERSWTLEQGAQRDIFNEGGRLERIVKQGRETTLQYSTDTGLLDSVTSYSGRQLQFEYTGGLMTAVIRPDGERITYDYEQTEPPLNSTEPGWRLVRVNYPDGTFRDYHYERDDFQNHLTGITDENGERFSTFHYDSAGQVTGSEHAGGVEQVSIDRRSDGTTVVTDPMGQQSTYRYTAVHNYRKLASVEGGPCATCSNTAQARTYDSNGHVTSRTGFNGITTTYTRDTYGRELSRTEAAGTPEQRTVQTEWELQRDLPIRITEPGRITEYAYDGNGNRLSQTVTDTASGESRTTSWTYNDHGQVLTVDGPRIDVGDITTYTYDAQGNLETITNTLGHETQYTDYDAHGNPLRIVDPNGIVTELEYDLRQRLVRRTVAAGTADAAVTTFNYDPVGQLIETVLPNGASIHYEYDAAHRLVAIEDIDGNRIDYTLDAMGNRVNEIVSGPGGAVFRETNRDYNTLNQLVTQTGGEGQVTTYEYDAEGNRTAIVDTDQNRTENRYDALDRLFETVDALSGVTQYAYDPRNNLMQVIDPRGVTTDYTYNGFNELVETDSPDAGTTTYAYDKAGNRISQTDARDITVTYSYDALNRLIFIDYPGTEQDITYGYDGTVTGAPNSTGRLTRITDESGTTEYYYGPRGNLLSKVSVVDGTTLAVDYGFDIADNLASMHYPSGATVTYTRDAAGRVTGLDVTPAQGSQVTVLSNIDYAPFGPVNTLTYGNALTETRGFDNDGRLTAITVPGVLERSFTWNTVNNITAIADNLDATATQSFDYDVLYRLIDASGVYGDFEWSYDTVGNRESQVFTPSGSTPETTTYTYAATSNRLDTITDVSGAVSYQYDATGNTLDNGDSAFIYDDRNRLVEAQDPVTQVTTGTYGHNALGQRVAKTIAGVTTLFAYDEAGHLIGEYDDQGNRIREYVWFGDTPIAMMDDTGVYYIHSDHLNTPKVVTDENQSVVWRVDYEPYGKANVIVDNIDFNLRFAGQYQDNETGLHQNYFRSYDPGTGRYTQSDPIGLNGGFGTYSYALENPMMLVDPMGLKPKGEWLQLPFPHAFNLRHRWGEAYRPDFIENAQIIPPSWTPIMLPYDVDVVFHWKIKCTDDERCGGSKGWTVSQATLPETFTVDIPFRLAPIPQLQKYATLANSVDLLTLLNQNPGTKSALTNMASAIRNSVDPTQVCELIRETR